nr:eukaryotic translation initiation factor 4 gamma 1 [Ciona intestinalis]|eukprot:XP_026694997.1 eukaryotic translation initiation factor 4 gamma 1 [Ciona intestinalis]
MQPPYTTPVTKHPNAPQIHSGHQYPQQSPHTTPTGVMQHGSPYMFLPHGGMPPALRPRYVPTSQTPSIINPTQAQLQPASPTYYHQPAGYFQSPMQTVPGYYGDTSHMQYHQPQQTQPIVIPTQQTPQQAPQHQQQVNSGSSTRNRSKVIIRDPNTLADVTSDVLQQPKKEGGAATGRSSATPTPPGQTVQNSDQQIVAQFAAQVAAAATGSPGRSPAPPAHVPMSTAPVRATPVHFHPPSPQQRGGQANVVIPSGVDTSLPPPTMPPNMNVPPPDITMQPATPQTYVAPLTTPAAPRPTPEQSYQEPPSKTATPEVRTQMHKSAPPDVVPQSVPIVTKRTEQPVPVAVVQPQQQTNNSSTASVINDALEKEAELKPEPKEEKKEEGAPDLISNTAVELTLEKINDTDTSDVNAKETSQNIEEKIPEENKVGDAPVIGKDVETVKEETKDEILEKKSIKEEEIAPKVVEAVAPSITVTSASPVVQKMDLKSEETPPKVVESNPKVEVVETPKESKVEAEKKEEEIKKPQETVTPVVKAPVKEVTKSDSNPKTPKPSEADKKDEKLQYAEDQWSPLNQEGKKVYNRSFLLQFRNLSLSKPQDLPNIDDIVMDRPNPKAASQLPSYDGMFRGDRQMPDFTPKYLNQGGHGRSTSRGMRGPQRSGGYQHQHQGPPSQPKVVIKKVSIQREDDPLVRSENAWKPSKLDSKATDLSEEEQQTAEILRNVRAILNKLTPQKFQPLLQKVQALDINTEVRLRGVIDLIFEKAIDEPSFCEPYANMCRMMSQFRVSSAPGSGSNTFEFRKILLTRCQREFEKDRTNEEALNALKVKIENAEKPEVKQQLNDDLELETMKQRRRMLGNIRFIGELFKLNMLTESIMHNCIMSLFRARDEDSLECLCRLLNTIGKGLDHVKGKVGCDLYYRVVGLANSG